VQRLGRCGARTSRPPATPASVAEAPQQVVIGVNAAVAQEGPDSAHLLAAPQVDVGQQQFPRAGPGLGQELTLRADDETAAPEVDAGTGPAGIRFEADAVAGEHRHAIGDGMAALHGNPGVALAGLFRLVVVWIPADR